MGKGKNHQKKPASEGGKRTSEKKNGEFTLKRVKGNFASISCPNFSAKLKHFPPSF
jgi:hypothetical protein